MTTAFVLSGGGSLAAVQVGMMHALSERGVHPDLVVGTSAGAVNAAYVAGHGTSPEVLDDLAALWASIRRHDVFPLRPTHAALAAVGLRESFSSSEPLSRFLAAHLPFTRLEEATLRLHVVTTDALTGEGVVLGEGDAVNSLIASCAIPGVFPGVRRGERVLCDGALACTSALTEAAELGADRIYLLPAGTACALPRAPRHPLAAALHAVTLLLQQRAVLETRLLAGAVQLRVLPPLCPLRVSPADFSQSRVLVERARAASGRWLDDGRDGSPSPERFLSLHDHRTTPTPSSHPLIERTCHDSPR